jgi:hypothetical protein
MLVHQCYWQTFTGNDEAEHPGDAEKPAPEAASEAG